MYTYVTEHKLQLAQPSITDRKNSSDQSNNCQGKHQTSLSVYTQLQALQPKYKLILLQMTQFTNNASSFPNHPILRSLHHFLTLHFRKQRAKKAKSPHENFLPAKLSSAAMSSIETISPIITRSTVLSYKRREI